MSAIKSCNGLAAPCHHFPPRPAPTAWVRAQAARRLTRVIPGHWPQFDPTSHSQHATSASSSVRESRNLTDGFRIELPIEGGGVERERARARAQEMVWRGSARARKTWCGAETDGRGVEESTVGASDGSIRPCPLAVTPRPNRLVLPPHTSHALYPPNSIKLALQREESLQRQLERL